MDLSTISLIFLFIVCLAGGIVIGLLISRFLKTNDDLPGEKEENKSLPPAREKIPAQPEVSGVRFGRDEKNELWLEMDGQPVKNRRKITPAQKTRLAQLVGDLGDWLELDFTPAREFAGYEPQPAKNSIFSRSSSESRPTRKEKPDLPKDDSVALGSGSMVEQIDRILQKKLVGSSLATLDIHLLEGPSGEVNVQIGAMKHLGVEAIPNPEIQDLIRQAVAEWENGVQ